MKVGMCMFLWTTSVGPEHEALIADIGATGFDGVEIPVFDGTPEDFARTGRMLDAPRAGPHRGLGAGRSGP